MKDKLKTDRARIQVGRISGFGLMEMSRQRLRPGMIEATTQPCPSCHGTGLIRSDDNMALSILRQIEEEGTRRRSREVLVRCPVGIANFLMNAKREHIAQIEARYGMSVRIEGDPALVSPDFTLEKFKTATRKVSAAEAPVVSVDASIMEGVDDAEVEEPQDEAASADNGGEEETKPKRRRRRRRRRKSSNAENEADASTEQTQEADDQAGDAPAEDAAPETPAEAETEESEKPAKKKSVSRSRSRSKKAETAEAEAQSEAEAEAEAAEPEDAPKPKKTRSTRSKAKAKTEDAAEGDAEKAKAKPAKSTRSRSKKAAKSETEPEPVAETAADPEPAAKAAPEPAPAPEPAAQPEPAPEPVAATAAPEPEAPPKPKRRGWWSLGSK